MKEFKVVNKVDNAEQYTGAQPHSDIYDNYVGAPVEAETAAEAIEFAIDKLCEDIRSNGYDCECDNETITVYDTDGNIYEQYYDFKVE